MDLALLLTGDGQAGEAAELLAPLAAAPNADLAVLTAQAAALKAHERFDEALAVYERAVHAFPANAVAEHNLAGVLGDVQRFAESEQAAAMRAFAKGLDAPETWLVLAKAQQGLGELDAAERVLREALRRRPAYADALGELAQLIWMRTEDVAGGAGPPRPGDRRFPMMTARGHRKAKLLEYAGD